MRARSFSHTGITVVDFDRFVQFYSRVFGCRLVAVGESDPARVRAFFGVEADEPRCRIGWLRAPGGGMLEIFHFTPSRPAEEVVWSRVGLTHISFDVRDSYAWYDYLVKEGVEIVSEVETSQHGHTFFFVKDCDGNLIEIIDLKYRYPLLKWFGWLAGWLFRRGMYRKYYEPREAFAPGGGD
ncbi:MAG: VOC family protein [Gemmatimonadetes bacterium]|nr:VOC family protein [Gemmatimonadota bacterium]